MYLWFALVDRSGVFRCLLSHQLGQFFFGLDVLFVFRFQCCVSVDPLLWYFQTRLPFLFNVFPDPRQVLLLCFDPALRCQDVFYAASRL